MTDKLEGFDPGKHLVNLRGKEYLEVKWRLVWLRQQHPDAVIETELTGHILNPPMAIFKARVSIPGGGSATGWGQEEAADFGDYLEKAETKSLGRALAALGFGTQFTDDFTFDETGAKVVDSPVERTGITPGQKQAAEAMKEIRAAQPQPGGPQRDGKVSQPKPTGAQTSPLLSDKQLSLIYLKGRGLYANEETVKETCQIVTGKIPEALTVKQASAFIDYLKAEELKSGAGPY